MELSVSDREICRLCAGMHSKSNMTCLLSENDAGQCILERIHKYTPFQINADDCLPKFVCIVCTNHIDHWHNFLQLCLKSQEGITSVYRNKETADKGQGKVPTRSVAGDSSNVTQPAVKTVHNGSSQKTVSSPDKHGQVLLYIDKSAAEKVKTFSAPHSTVGENISVADVLVKKANISTNARRNYCIARWCNNSTKHNPSLSLFRVPKNRNRAAEWLQNAEREDLLHLDLNILHCRFLCSEHFTEDMFTNSTRSRLVWNAVPTVFLKPRFAEKMRKAQADAAVERMAMEMLHSSFPTRIMPKPDCKSVSSVPLSADTVTPTIRIQEIQEKPMDVAQAEPNDCENINSTELLNSLPPKAAHNSSVKVNSEDIVATESQPQSTFLTESMCSFQESHEPVFPCRYCGEIFLVKSSLILHQTTYHPEHSVGCEQCGKVNYSSKSEFMGHLCDHAGTEMDQV